MAYVYVPVGGDPDGEEAVSEVADVEEPVPAEPPDPLAVRAGVGVDGDRPEPPVRVDPALDAAAEASVVVVATVLVGPPTTVADEPEAPPGAPGPGEMVVGARLPLRSPRCVVPMPMAAPAPTTRSATARAPTALPPAGTVKSLICREW